MKQSLGVYFKAHALHQNLLFTGAVVADTSHFYNDALLDHFSGPPVSWNQQFFVIQDYWKAGGPVFLLINGETPAGPPSDYWYMHELGQQHGALLVTLEHRFYGESQPFDTTSVEHLRFLTSEQALGDIARFISYLARGSTTLTATTPELTLNQSCAGSQFVLFGGSYAGNLVAWFKIKYPMLAVGVIASSAPLFVESNFEQFADGTGEALQNAAIGGSSACFSAVEEAITEVHRLAKLSMSDPSSGPPGSLAPCARLASIKDLALWETYVYGYFQTQVMYNDPVNAQIASICTTMASASSPLAGLESLLSQWGACVPASFQDSLLLNTSSSAGMARPFTWQTCNEFGYFQTTTSESGSALSPFKAFVENNLQFNLDVCLATFPGAFDGSEFPAITETLTTYGGRNIQGTNITFPSGSMDPWSSLSIVNRSSPFYSSCVGRNCNAMFADQNLGAGNTNVYIADTAHCADMYALQDGPGYPAIAWAYEVIAKRVSTYLAVAPSSAGCCVPSDPSTCELSAVVECVGAFDPFCFSVFDGQCIQEAIDFCSLQCTQALSGCV